MFASEWRSRACVSQRHPGRLFFLGQYRPHLRKHAGIWYCDGSKTIGWGKTWREAYATWVRNTTPQNVVAEPPKFTYSWHTKAKPGEVIEFNVPTRMQRVWAWFDRFFGERT